MKENINLIGGFFGHVCQHDLHYLNVSKTRTCQMCDMKSSNNWTLMVLCSFKGWTQIVQLPVFRLIRLKKTLPKRI